MSHLWLRTDISANRYVDTYFKGFVDISGGDLYLRHGQMGIGTTTPTSGYKLDVNGNAIVTGNAKVTGSLYMSTWIQSNTGDIKLQPNSGDNNVIVNRGNLDIGSGMLVGKSDATYFKIKHKDYTTSSTIPEQIRLRNDGDVYITSTSDSGKGIRFYNSDTETMRITQGNVGIGTTTPQAKLHIEYKGGSIGDFTGLRIANHATNLHTTSRPAYEFIVSDLADTTINSDGTISGGIGASKFSIRYRATNNESDPYYDRLIIDNTGNVGIGTTSPEYALDVSGSVSAQRGTNGHVSYFGNVAIGDLGFDGHAGIAFHRSTTYDTSFALLQSSGGETFLNCSSGQDMYFQVGNATKMTITSGGNVGIGTTPGSAYKLDVNGTIHGTSLNINSSDFTVDSAGNISANSLSTATLNNGADLSLPTTGGTLALTSQLHSEVSLSSDTNYLSIIGQQITGGTIPVDSGGTNITSYADGDILYATGTTTLTKLSKGTNNSILQVNSAGTLQYGTVTNAMLAGSITDTKLSTISTADKVSGSAVQLAGTSAIENSSGLRLKDELAGGGLSMSSQVLSVNADQSSRITKVGELNGLDVNGPVHVYPSGGSEGGEITLAYPYISSSSATQNQWHIDVSGNNNFRIFSCEEGSACVHAINISTDGKIGIGGNPDSGGSKLKMYGQIDMNSNWIGNAGGVNAPYYQGPGDVLFKANNIATLESTTSYIDFKTGSTTRMRIDANGNVGIGTTTPTSGYKLDVNGNAIVTGSAKVTAVLYMSTWLQSTTGDIKLQPDSDNNNVIVNRGNLDISSGMLVGKSDATYFKIKHKDYTTSSTIYEQIRLLNDGDVYIASTSDSGKGIRFYNSDTETMRITQGNVGIGTTSPGYPLEVHGSEVKGGSYAYLHYSSNIRLDTSSDDRNVSIYAIHSIWTNNYVLSSSDQRIKTNILDIQDDAALQSLRSIQPKTYNYKDVVSRGNSTVYGFIAQQIKEVLPGAVSVESTSIPNIYENTEVSTVNGIYNTISFTDFDTADLDASSNSIVVKDLQNKDHTVTITEVIDSQTIRVDTDLSEWMGAIDASGNVTRNEVQTYSQVILDASNNVVLENYDIEPIASIDASDNVVGKMADLTGDNTIDSSGNYVDASGNTIAAINADGHYIDASGNYFDTDGNFKDASGSLIGTYKAEWKNIIINGTSIFVYGQEVDDFHILNKDAIFTVATAALQEVDRQLQAEKAKTATLEAKTVTLESDLAAEKAKVATMESQMADVFARLQALESA